MSAYTSAAVTGMQGAHMHAKASLLLTYVVLHYSVIGHMHLSANLSNMLPCWSGFPLHQISPTTEGLVGVSKPMQHVQWAEQQSAHIMTQPRLQNLAEVDTLP